MTAAILQPDNDALLNRGWAALPAPYRLPAVKPTLEEALTWRQQWAESHRHDFEFATWFLPKAVRSHFQTIYAYWRMPAEVSDPSASLALIDSWSRELDACYAGQARHPIFVALAETIRECAIPKDLLADILTAFRQDQTVTRYDNMSDLLSYCRLSANPIGRLMLYVCGEADEERFKLSDATCSALQLAYLWRDVCADWQKGRVYLPQEDMQRFGVTDETIAKGIATSEFRALLDYEVDFARRLFEEGLPLIDMVGTDLAANLDLLNRGGLATLRAIERRDYDVLSARPALSKRSKLALALRAVSGRFLPTPRLGVR